MTHSQNGILCDAVPFCFGPVSKLLAVANRLSDFAELALLASGTSMELGAEGGGRSPFRRIIACDTENTKELQRHRALFKKSDFFVDVMNPVSAKYARGLKLPMAHIDSLFWMWNAIPEEAAESELYFIQNFDGVKEQLERFEGRLKNPLVVGPIIEEKPIVAEKNQLLVNFGGIESALIRIGKNSDYPFTVGKILFEILEGNNFDSVVFAGLGKIMHRLEKMSTLENAKFVSLPHNDFLRELAASRLLLTSPGLTASFEAFSFGIPALFLPPQNYSQYFNLKKFKKHGLVFKDTNWNAVFPGFELEENEPEEQGVAKVLGAIARFGKSQESQRKMLETMRDAIALGKSKAGSLAGRQGAYLDSLGGNGTKAVARGIIDFLEAGQ